MVLDRLTTWNSVAVNTIDELIKNNEDFAKGFDNAGLGPEPRKKLVVLTCMDARIDPAAMLGLELGDAHVLRNAGGVISDDVVRSLTLSQSLLGTVEIMIVQHTECGLHGLREDELRAEIARDTGKEPGFPFLGFEDVRDSVRTSIAELSNEPLLPATVTIRGFVYDVRSGRLEEVSP